MGFSPLVNGVEPIRPVGRAPSFSFAMRIRENWRELLTAIVEEKDNNRAALSKEAKLNQTYLRDVLDRNQTPSMRSAQKLSAGLGVNVTDWLIEPGNSVEVSDGDNVVDIAGREFARLPIYDIRFAAGAGSENYDEEPLDHYFLSLSMLRSMTASPLGQIAGFQVDGDSMEPTLHHRDWVICDLTRTRLSNPGIYTLNFEGDALIKRASQHFETKAVTLTSDNPKYRPMVIKKPDRLTVIGRMFLSIRRH